MHIIGWILFGLSIGSIARFLIPRHVFGGWTVTIALGIGGALGGGLLGTVIAKLLRLSGRPIAGWSIAIAGAITLLFIYGVVVGKKRLI